MPIQENKFVSNEANPDAAIRCPFCGSQETQLETDFGTTLAYAQFYCRQCRTPFEWIKWEDKSFSSDLPRFFTAEKCQS